MNKIMEKLDSGAISKVLGEGFQKIKIKDSDSKKDVNLIDITKKLSEKKFGKKKK